MIEITDEEWELLKQYFGDLAYEEPHNHGRFLAALEIFDRAPDVPPDPGDEMPE